ncbi:S-layer protein [Candidatus Micrarchaeota archaeon]|nr:S-layer protein [Candidatus Micrarchaeota archaeon]
MKGINLKKIGAIVAGSAILASSVAFAGLVYQNTPLVDANGQPVVKIVVGERAAASDGVVAAYVASKIANEAYKSSTLTAEVVGDGTCTGASGTGTCSVVAGSEKVTLLVTVPGAGAADRIDYSAAIGDYLDRELQNRYKQGYNIPPTVATDADEQYTVLDDYADEEANPYQDYIGDYVDGDFNTMDFQAMVRAGSEFGPFATVTVQPKGSSNPVKEDQFLTFSGMNSWDSGDEMLKSDLSEAGYTVVFGTGNDYGLPLCPGDEGLPPTSHVIGGESCADTDELPSKKVFIKFMNEDWIISEISPSTSATGVTIDQQTYHTDGSSIKLAKEAVSGIINVGEFLDAGNGYKVRLDDISREVGVGNDHPAIITVLDSNDNEVCQDQVWPGDTEDNLCDTTGVKLHVYQTAPGVMLIAKWAEMGIFSDEIELVDGQEFIEDSGSEWDVILGWENKGADPKTDPEYLRTITLYSTDAEGMDEMEPGDNLGVVDLPDYEKFQVTYNGIDDEGVEYDELRYKVETGAKHMQIRNGTLATDTCYIDILGGASGQPYVKVTSSKGEFRSNVVPWYAGGLTPTQKKGAEMYWLPLGASDDTCGYGGLGSDAVLLKDSDGNWWFFPAGASSDSWFYYRWAGSKGMIAVNEAGPPGIWMVEDIGKIKTDDIAPPTVTTYNAYDTLGFLFTPGYELLGIDGEDDEVSQIIHDDDIGSVQYLDMGQFGYANSWSGAPWEDFQMKFTSPRGTQFTSSSGTSKTFKVPKSLLKATYTLSTVEAATAEADQTTLVLGEGDEATIGTSGVKIKVLNITESLTPCTFGTGAGAVPTCDMSGVSAVIMPNNAASVPAKEVFPITSNMVVLDRDATALETGTVITIGGDAVNTVTASAIAGSGVDFAAQPVVVRAIGNKIVVAGLTSEDTITAGQQFVAGVTRN